jgi:chlorobactene glucosyltransferase
MSWWLAMLLFATLPVATLGLSLFNLAVWPRGRAAGAGPNEDNGGSRPAEGGISVLVPAREEEGTIERCIRSIFGADGEVDEVVVYEDRSTDATPEILDELCEEYPNLRVVPGEPLPEGWVGKPHACHRLSRAAGGDILVFVDADTEIRPSGIDRLVSILEEGPSGRADLVTAVPRQMCETWAEALVVPLLHLTYTSWLPLPLIWRSGDPRFLAANGQVMAVRRDSLEEVGGFEAVRADVVDDMALGRAFKRAGSTVVFADGTPIAACRMYESWSQIWEGFSKNLYEGIGEHPATLALVIALYTAAFLAPWIAAPIGWAVGAGAVAGAAAIGVASNLALRSILAIRFRHPARSVLVHPFGVAALLAIAVNSFLWHRRGEVRWAGRVYGARGER